MAVEVPSSLIRQIQAILREEAGVSTFDPGDPALRDLAPAEEAISGLDPSAPPYLRCKECRAALLRGLQSTVCVYCGAEQRRGVPPLTVSYNTTLAYRKLLQSLDLDGSEVVSPYTESKDSGKVQDTEKDRLVLSGLLDMELRWPYEGEQVQNSSTNNAPISPLNLSGVDLDNFFSETKKEMGSNEHHISEETSWLPKETDSENFGLFEDLRPSDKVADPLENKPSDFGDSVAIWQAEFQSASSHISATGTDSNDFFQGSSSNYASATVEEQSSIKSGMNHEVNNPEFSNSSNQLPSLNDDWPLDDLWHTANSNMSNAVEQFNGKSNADDGNWARTDLWPTGSTSVLSTNENIQSNDDSYDDWQDFTSSGNAPDALSNSSIQTSTGVTLPNEHESGISSVSFADKLEDMDFGSFIQSDMLPGSSDFKKDSSELGVMQSELSVSGRTSQREKMETDANILAVADKNEILASTKSSGNANVSVEALLSQMHDLSFMLEDNLSIPKKADSSGGT